MFESHFKSHIEPVLTADKNYRIVRDGDSESRKSSLMIGLVLVIMFLVISGWNFMIQPAVLHDSFTKLCLFVKAMLATNEGRSQNSDTFRSKFLTSRHSSPNVFN